MVLPTAYQVWSLGVKGLGFRVQGLGRDLGGWGVSQVVGFRAGTYFSDIRDSRIIGSPDYPLFTTFPSTKLY